MATNVCASPFGPVGVSHTYISPNFLPTEWRCGPTGYASLVESFAFEGARLGMRPWRVEDLAGFHLIFGDERVIWWGDAKATMKLSAVGLHQAIDEQDSPMVGLGRFAVVRKDDGEIVGNVMLRPANFAEGMEVGYHIAHRAWGRGHATEAAVAALEYGFGRMKLKRIIAAVALDNARSLRVMDKLGMRVEYEAEYAGLAHRMFEKLSPSAQVASGTRH